MSFRTLLAIFAALALLFAPAMTRAGEAYAAVPDHHGQMMEQGGHCQMPPSGSKDHDKAQGKNCCISMCMAVAVAPSSPAIEKMTKRAPAVFQVPSFHTSTPAELATPPPKLA